MICSFNTTIEKWANGKAFISWLVPSFSQHDLRLVVFGTLFGHLISVMSLQDKFASLRQVNSPNSQNKFQIIMVYRHVFDMIVIAFRGILCVFMNFAGFCSSNYQKPGNTHKTGNNAIKMSQVFQDIAHFEHFTDPNLFKYVFNVIQNWKTNSLQFFRWCLFFVSSYCRRRWK